MQARLKRALASAAAGAIAFAAAGALATPAHAADGADLELSVTGTTLAADASWKWGEFTIGNAGTEESKEIRFSIETTKLNADKVKFELPGNCGEEPIDDPDFKGYFCVYTTLTLGPGESFDDYFTFTKVGDASGNAGQVKITIETDNDPNPKNNVAVFDIELSEDSGVDLVAWPYDVYAFDEAEGVITGEPVLPGESTRFWAEVANYGDAIAEGLRLNIKLPEHVTFFGEEPDCDYVTGSSEAVCEYNKIVLHPIDAIDFDDEKETRIAGTKFFFHVGVSEDAPGPVNVSGEFSVEAIAQALVEQPKAQARIATTPETTELPENAEPMTEAELAEVDPSDNSDEFVVYIGKKDGGTGGGLPVTGANVTTIAGAGALVSAVGGALFFASRRRRITV